jgi:hypothetical protein
MTYNRIMWRGINAKSHKLTLIVDYPDKVWSFTGDGDRAVANGWKVIQVYADGTPVKMVGCTGGCGCTKPSHQFASKFSDSDNGLLVTLYICRQCGGRGEPEAYVFDPNLITELQNATDSYAAALKQMKLARGIINEHLDRLNNDWNTFQTFDDVMEL